MKQRFLWRRHGGAPVFFLSFSPLPFSFGFRGQRGSVRVLNYNVVTILERKMLAENVKPFFFFFLFFFPSPFCTVSIPTSKTYGCNYGTKLNAIKSTVAKIVEVFERLFNLLPVICDIITLIYVEQPVGILYIKQRVCVFWNLILVKYLTSWMG